MSFIFFESCFFKFVSFHSKVPKAGSTTMGSMLSSVAERNGVGWRNCQVAISAFFSAKDLEQKHAEQYFLNCT